VGGRRRVPFRWKKVDGDFDLSAVVTFVGTGAEDHRKAALVVRQSLDPKSTYADVALHGDGPDLTSVPPCPWRGDIRSSISREGSGSPKPGSHGAQTDHVRRKDRRRHALGPVTIEFKGPVYVGLGVCSHDANVLEPRFSLGASPGTPRHRQQSQPHQGPQRSVGLRSVDKNGKRGLLGGHPMEAPNWTPDGKS